MPFSKSKIMLAGGLGAAALGLVGVGTGATFTTATASSQTVNGGHLHVSVSANGASCTNNDASGCHALTLPAVGPVGSTFETTPTVVTFTNTGDIPAHFGDIQISQTNGGDAASTALLNEMNICIQSTDPGFQAGYEPGQHTWVEGNGPLTAATALTPTVHENDVVLKPGHSATYWVDFYAGKDSACGAKYSDGPNTTTAWTNQVGHGYTTPASLNDDAQGGTVTPTLSFSFTG